MPTVLTRRLAAFGTKGSYFSECEREHGHCLPRGEAGQEGQVEQPKAQMSREDKKARYAELKKQMDVLAAKGNLTGQEADKFKKIAAEMSSMLFDAAKPLTPDKIQPASDRKSTLSVNVVLAANADLLKSKDVYMAIAASAAGVAHNAYTPVDEIMAGKNPAVSAKELVQTFSATRKALREQYGGNVSCFRAVGKQMAKPTENWATTREFAAQFGSNVVEKEIPIDQIIAVNVGLRGNYHELIVDAAQKQEPATSSTTLHHKSYTAPCAKASLFPGMTNCHWRTIGGRKTTSGGKHGGSKICISDEGKVIKGNAKFIGKDIKAIRAMTGKTGVRLPSAWRMYAKKNGVSPKELHDLAHEIGAHDAEFVKERQAMLKDARQRLDAHARNRPGWNTGIHRLIHTDKVQQGDWTQIQGFDEVAVELASRYPEIFNLDPEKESAEVTLWDMLKEGNPEPMDEGDAYREALDILVEHKKRKEPEEEHGEAWEGEPGQAQETAESEPWEEESQAAAAAPSRPSESTGSQTGITKVIPEEEQQGPAGEAILKKFEGIDFDKITREEWITISNNPGIRQASWVKVKPLGGVSSHDTLESRWQAAAGAGMRYWLAHGKQSSFLSPAELYDGWQASRQQGNKSLYQAEDALKLLAGRKDMREPGWAYKLDDDAHYGMDVVNDGPVKTDNQKFAIMGLPFAAAQGRDRTGDFTEIGPNEFGEGILTENHQRNPLAYIDHGAAGKTCPWPIGKCEDENHQYCVHLMPDRGMALADIYLSRSVKEAVQCFGLYEEGILKSGSIGYRVIKARPLPCDASKGFGKRKDGTCGLHLVETELLEVSAVSLPMNADCVIKALGMTFEGSPLCPAWRAALEPYAPALKEQVTSGWKSQIGTQAEQVANAEECARQGKPYGASGLGLGTCGDHKPGEKPTDSNESVGKNKFKWNGLTIVVEYPRGSVRSGVDRNGKSWQIRMAHDYGRILRTEGNDGEHVDVFLGPHLDSHRIFVVNQVKEDGSFDEHKVMLLFDSLEEARQGYLDCYSSGWKGLGSIVEIALNSGLKKFLKSGDTSRPLPDPVDENLWAECLAVIPEKQPTHLPSLLGEVDGCKVILVDGDEIQLRVNQPEDMTHPHADFIAGANDEEATWVKREFGERTILVDDDYRWSQSPCTVYHEAVERRHMASGDDYDTSHDKANEVASVLLWRVKEKADNRDSTLTSGEPNESPGAPNIGNNGKKDCACGCGGKCGCSTKAWKPPHCGNCGLAYEHKGGEFWHLCPEVQTKDAIDLLRNKQAVMPGAPAMSWQDAATGGAFVPPPGGVRKRKKGEPRLRWKGGFGTKAFDETKITRKPEGSEGGGQFSSGGESGGTSQEDKPAQAQSGEQAKPAETKPEEKPSTETEPKKTKLSRKDRPPVPPEQAAAARKTLDAAFTPELVKQLVGQAFNQMSSQLKSKGLFPEAIVSLAWEKALTTMKNSGGYQEPGAAAALLKESVIRTIQDEARKIKKTGSVKNPESFTTTDSEGKERSHDPAATDKSPEGQAIEREQRRILEAAIAKLPERDRQVMEMVYSGKKDKEIAADTGIGEENVKKIRQRAKQAFRERLNPHQEDREDQED